MKKLSYLFSALALALSHVMCFVVGYNYRAMLCGIAHEGFSAPASVAFLCTIPYFSVIVVFVILAIVFYKKAK